MRKALKDMLGSKKAVAMIAGLIVSFAGKYGLALPTEELIAVLSPLIAYIFSQGLADIGKEKAKVDRTAIFQHTRILVREQFRSLGAARAGSER